MNKNDASITLDMLKQKIINYLYSLECYESYDIELLKIILK